MNLPALRRIKQGQRAIRQCFLLTVTFNSTISFWFLYFPVAPIILPFDFGEEPINSGDSTSLMCSISKGDLPIDIYWLHNNKTIDSNDGIIANKVGKKVANLIIDSVQAFHAGEYTCVARNKAGMTSYSTYLHVNGTYSVCFACFFQCRCFCVYLFLYSFNPRYFEDDVYKLHFTKGNRLIRSTLIMNGIDRSFIIYDFKLSLKYSHSISARSQLILAN